MTEKITTLTLLKKKTLGKKIVCLTAYDYLIAQLFDKAGVDLLLVGDSVANVVYGHTTTLPVGMTEMLAHTQAVAKATKRALVVADMPFMSYQLSPEDALRNAGRFLKVGAEAVKIEGGSAILVTVEKLVKSGIPVMGHLGLTPQSVHLLGGYRLQARTKEAQEKLLNDALALENAGCFAIVLEKIPLSLAKKVTETIKIPTIGIGAGPYCDGQILVWQDMLGLSLNKFRFVKEYANLYQIIFDAVKKYIEEVNEGIFPSMEHSFDDDQSCP
ncbi:MAG: 3-methyl-2-oxobutanoate hydroxymethyltransferase [candidate division WOR-3 bacterium]|nr:3-methyl-2-oxobutanoate hydroxymethyltransferase [candidate division WOR-3 bacterium]MCX7757683.1 3-methyl-2-oxobutanoate hydroxymethyltransferase [candidate division WOR-3 bacterium]MDW7987954.1 3-methyl-2-oxobutanoate hydroxymethyltransferase [candidate division WOR-3 bacterium]